MDDKPTVKMLNFAYSLAEELRIEDNYNQNFKITKAGVQA